MVGLPADGLPGVDGRQQHQHPLLLARYWRIHPDEEMASKNHETVVFEVGCMHGRYGAGLARESFTPPSLFGKCAPF